MSRRVGILTGGGDVPGLNVAIKAAVERATDLGWQMCGIRRGWSGLVELDVALPVAEQDCSLELDSAVVRTIDRTGGTFLHSSRCNPARVLFKDLPKHLPQSVKIEDEPIDCTPQVEAAINHLGLDAMIAIGGDDTLSYAARLHHHGLPVVTIPKTMDNDVYGTDYCIGFSTAVSRSVDAIDSLRSTAGSHERAAVIELFGRNCGETSLIAAHLAGADRALISEVPFDIELLAKLTAGDVESNPSRYAIICISEGAAPIGGQVLSSGIPDPYGHRKLGGIGQHVANELSHRGIDTLSQQLGYLMRSGSPDALDRMVARSFGQMAIDVLDAGQTGRMTAITEGRYTTVSVEEPVKGEKRVDIERLYDPLAYRPRVVGIEGMPMFLH